MFGPKLGEGREAEVFQLGCRCGNQVLSQGFSRVPATESLALAQLDGHVITPRLIDVVERDGRTGVVLERFDGSDMLALLQKRPWRVFSLARRLAGTHLAIHDIQAPPGLAGLRDVLATRIEDVDLPPRLRGFVSGVLDRLPPSDRLCHGDYHPGNVLISGGQASVIDWAGTARGIPEADHAPVFSRADSRRAIPAGWFRLRWRWRW